MMGGIITLKSEQGKGSTFTLTLPFKKAANTDLVASEQQLTQLVKREAADIIEIPQLAGSILCADDNADNLRLAEYLISKTGAQLTLVSDGEQAFENAMMHDYDLILMDMQMPVMSGTEATELLKGAGCPSPIVMLTANVDSASREEIETAGADGYFAKPIDTQKFYSMLSEYLQGSGENTVQMTDNNEELQQLKAQFVAGLADYQAQLQQIIKNRDWTLAKSLCHQLKGNAGLYGFEQLGNAARDMESLLSDEDEDNKLAALNKLINEIGDAQNAE